jgi:hypothetical protein
VRSLLGFLALLAIAVSGCSDGNAALKTTTGDETTATRKTWDPALGTASIAGTVRLAGEPPRRRVLDVSERVCKEHHGDNLPTDESVIVNADGTLRNVVVWVKKGLEGWTFPVPSEPAILDQVGCTYVPHVLGMRAKQPLQIRNSDPVLHNVHSLPTRNQDFNIGQPTKGTVDSRTFANREVAIRFKCDVHGWMSAYVAVVDHPYFAVTGDGGVFSLAKLPPGTYEVEAWHEVYGTSSQSVKIADGESKTLEFTFTGRAKK